MGYKYCFRLARVDYVIHTRSGDWGTDSKVELQVLTKRGGTWEVISARLPEPGKTERLDAGARESFSRRFTEPVDIGVSVDDPLAYRNLVRFRFRIHGSDAWSPSEIRMTPTFHRNEDYGVSPLWSHITETWDYNPNNWILSTDPADGTSKDKDGNPATLTLRY